MGHGALVSTLGCKFDGQILDSRPACRDSGNDFDLFSFPFLEGRILVIRAPCNYPTRNAKWTSTASMVDVQRRPSTTSKAQSG